MIRLTIPTVACYCYDTGHEAVDGEWIDRALVVLQFRRLRSRASYLPTARRELWWVWRGFYNDFVQRCSKGAIGNLPLVLQAAAFPSV